MPFQNDILGGSSGQGGAYTIDQSCRFNEPDDPSLTRTPGSAGDRKLWTFSCWFKPATVAVSGDETHLFTADDMAAQNGWYEYVRFIASTGKVQWQVVQSDGSGKEGKIIPTMVFRDPSAWYHIVFRYNSANATPADRMRIYVNGDLVTAFDEQTNPAQNHDSMYFNNDKLQCLGNAYSASANQWNGYIAEAYFIDGQGLGADSFGETDSDTNQWIPIDASTLTFGSNGFYQKYVSGEPDTFFADSSGSNVFTPTESLSVNYLVIGGGGGGSISAGSGGGGGGGFRTGTGYAVTAQAYPIVVGVGGNNYPNQEKSNVASGGDSSFATIHATGGGAGSGSNTVGKSGGSGGGAGYTANGGAGNSGGYSPVEGYAGGNGAPSAGGGGGGASEVGQNATPSIGISGAGGDGVSSSITGSAVTYSGGGGGGGYPPSTNGAGGTGGGGNGTNAANGNPGTNGLGGGGGGVGEGSTQAGSMGGSGIVIISYQSSTAKATGGTITTYGSGGGQYYVHSFTKASGRSNEFTTYTGTGGSAGNDIYVKGAIVQSMAQKKIGASSIYWPYQDVRMEVPPGYPPWSFTGEFTIEAWVYRHVDSTGTEYWFAINNVNNSSPGGSEKLILYTSTNDLAVKVNGTDEITGVTISKETWHHVAVTRNSSNVITVWVNGVSQATDTVSGTIGSSTGQLIIGGNATNPIVVEYQGYMDEIRISDTCRYTATFTPTTVEFVTDNNTLLLIHSNWDGGFGADSSGNGNTFTTTNLEASDQMLDSPTNDFATLNSLVKPYGTSTFAEGNLKVTTSSAWNSILGNIPMSSGKWYWEALLTSTNFAVGVMPDNFPASTSGPHASYGIIYRSNGDKEIDGTATSYGDTFGGGDILGYAVDMDASTITFYKNNASQGAVSFSGTVASAASVIPGGVSLSDISYFNFGSDSSFAGQKTSQGNQDENDIGDFYFTPPTDYLALCTSNLADPSIKLPGANFNTQIWSGNDTTDRAMTGLGFQPDLVWIKQRDGAEQACMYDVIRTPTKFLAPSATTVEGTLTEGLTSFDSDGWTMGDDTANNGSSKTYAGWTWKGGGTGVANTTGTIDSTVSANATAGFSIVGYTGTDSAGTVGHGLSVAPDMIILKERNGVAQWPVGCLQDPMNWTDYIALDKANNFGDYNYWNDTTPTASVFSLSGDADVNESTKNYIAYCFHSVEGYSKIGHYYGNGITANYGGTFISTMFRPAFVLIKCMDDSSTNWLMFDKLREGYNKDNDRLLANDTLAEDTTDFIDILSNGFKLISTHSDVGTNNSRYLYYAVAKSPFKYANAR